jgi:hypothetical protein
MITLENAHEVTAIPLGKAYLCPDMNCRAISNLPKCPYCDSETLLLSAILDSKEESCSEKFSTASI